MKKTFKVADISTIALFVALISVCSWINIPFTVPITFQILAVFVAAYYLGLKRGLICVSVYLAIGIVGVPVFSGFQGGIGHILGPTGGFLLGFVIATVIIGFFSKRKTSFRTVFLYMFLSLIVCYMVGIVWMLISTGDLSTDSIKESLILFILLYSIDIVKVFLAAIIAVRLKKIGSENFG